MHRLKVRSNTQRYESAQAFADDVRSYLDHKPILATRPSVATRVKKWTQRHRTLSTSFMVALICGIVASSIVVVIKDRDGNKVAEIVVPRGGSAIIQDRNAPPRRAVKVVSPAENTLPGLIPHPEKLSGVGRWQLITTRPSTFEKHHWSLDWSLFF